MPTTISGGFITGVTLNSTASNPVSVTATIAAPTSDGLYGIGGTIASGGGALYSWTIRNSGTIGSAFNVGLRLGLVNTAVASSFVTNTAGGVIDGLNTGVYIVGPASVTNLSGGSITGTSTSGIYIGSGAGTIVNQGVLLGGNYGAAEGQGGSVTNQLGGIITGTTVAGVLINIAPGTVVNFGSILGGAYGVQEVVGGSVTNQSAATITGTADAVFMLSGVGTVVNSGILLGGSIGAKEAVGGSVTNLSGGRITGTDEQGILITGAAGTVVNNGSVAGKYVGVYLGLGGSVTNQSSGAVTSTLSNGIYVTGGVGTVVNSGSVRGYYSGIDLNLGGTVTNLSGATIRGSQHDGISIATAPGTIVNSGSVYGASFGVYLGDGGSITNKAGAIISSGAGGILLEAVGTVTNAGTIDAGGPTDVAVQIGYSGSTLAVDPGAVFSGTIAGAAGVVIELASGSSAGTLSGFDGNSITNFTSLQFDPGAKWTVSGTYAASGLGTIDISGFTIHDTIDLTGFIATSDSIAAPGVLVLSDGIGDNATLNIQGAISTAGFTYATDGSSGTDVTATCYAAGTRIRTARGEVPVERLREGDMALTVSGSTQPIGWIGHRRVDFRRRPNRQRFLPVRVAADAFGQGLPERDLVLSPDHAVFVENVLIPIRHLVNDSTIVQIDCDTITYYHVELPRHDVLLAEGMPAESYLEAGARNAFANFDGAIQLHPDFTPPRDHYAMLWESEGYAPLVVSGEPLDRARRNLARQAALIVQAGSAPARQQGDIVTFVA